MFRRTGVALPELLIAFAVLAAGVVVAMNAGREWGVIGYVGGFSAGSLGALLAFAASGLSIAFTIGLLTGVPEYPACSNGTCHDRKPPDSDYRYEDLDGQLVARCKCGIAYVKQGRRVLRLEPDGSRNPFMIWIPWRGWVEDLE